MLKDSGHENQTRQGWGGVGLSISLHSFPAATPFLSRSRGSYSCSPFLIFAVSTIWEPEADWTELMSKHKYDDLSHWNWEIQFQFIFIFPLRTALNIHITFLLQRLLVDAGRFSQTLQDPKLTQK